MWYSDQLLMDTNYCAIFSKTGDTGKGLFTGWTGSRNLEFSVGNHWGDPPPNPINSIVSSVASSLNSASMMAESLKNTMQHLASEGAEKANTLGVISDKTKQGIENTITKAAGMFMNPGKIVVPAAEYYKTYQGTEFTVPSLSITTVFVNDETESASDVLSLQNPYSKMSLEQIITALLPTFDEKDNTGTGLFMTLTAPGGYHIPPNLTSDMTDYTYQLTWGGDPSNPIVLKNLLVDNISIVKSNVYCRCQVKKGAEGRGTGKKQNLYAILTLNLIPARAYTRDTFLKAIKGN